MKIEKLTDNQFRCTIDRDDLLDRHIRLSELAYGSEKARRLFQEILSLAFDEFGFEADNIPLVIEAIPMPGEGLTLIVTKVEDPEELDTRFSRFSRFALDDSEDDHENPDQGLGLKDIMQLLHQLGKGIADGDVSITGHLIPLQEDNTSDGGASSDSAESRKPSRQEDREDVSRSSLQLFSFDSLDAVSALCARIRPVFSGNSVLYKDTDHGRYLLVLQHLKTSSDDYTRISAAAAEYGRRERCSKATLAYCNEHLEQLIADHAVDMMAGL